MTNAEILDRFPGPARLVQSRWKNLLICVVFALLAGQGLDQPVKFKMWLPLVCFGPVALYNLLALLPWANVLTLHNDQLQWTRFFVRWSVPWTDAHNFRVVGTGRHAQVAFQDARKSSGRVSPLGTRDFVISSYGRSADDLAALLTQWRERALSPTC